MRQAHSNFIDALTGKPGTLTVEDGIVVAPIDGEETVDLGGQYMLPAFVDSHCHILPTGLDLQKLHLGVANSHSDVLELVRQRHVDQPDGWLMAVHYDQTKYEAARHLTRQELDAITAERPILLRHVNGHASVANSAALRAAGVDETTCDPSGGSYGRDASGSLTGVLLEDGHEQVSHAAPPPDLAEMVAAILAAGEKMGALGIGCASDMMTGRYNLDLELQAYRLAAVQGCKVRTRLYVQWKEVFGPRGIGLDAFRERLNDFDDPARCRVAGIKIFADGAIGSATAAIYGRYTGETATGPVLSANSRRAENGEREVSGQLIYSPERLRNMVLTAHEAGFQVCTHTIGDYSTDLVMDAYEATGEPERHRIEHAMILSDSQIERMALLDSYCTFQPEFLLRFGHSYKRQLVPEMASKLKRTRSVLDAGVKLSFSSDRPIVAGNPWDGIVTASERPEGFDPSENCTRREAILAYTIEGSRVNGDGDTMGNLSVGSFGDFQLYATDPMDSRLTLVQE